jgi:HEAT repeat protein
MKHALLAMIFVATSVTGICQAQTNVDQKIQELSSSDPARRASAACALQKLGSRAEPAIPALIALLNDGTRVAPELVCYREYFSEAMINPEFPGLVEPSPGEASVQALIALGHPSVEPLIGALKESNWRTRKNAAQAFVYLRDARALKPLMAALKDDAWQVRAHAATALGVGQQRSELMAGPLTIALKDSYGPVRWAAATSLGLIRDTRAVPALIDSLKSGDGKLRMLAATALGHIRDGRAIEPLTYALKDESAQVRRNAQRALEEIRPQ